MSYISSTASQADLSDGIADGVIDISFYRNHVVYIKLDKKMIGLTTDIDELRVGETYCIILQQNEKGKCKVYLFKKKRKITYWNMFNIGNSRLRKDNVHFLRYSRKN